MKGKKLAAKIMLGLLLATPYGIVEAASAGSSNESSSKNINITGAYDYGIIRDTSGISDYSGNEILIDIKEDNYSWGKGSVGVRATRTNKGTERAVINLGNNKTEIVSVNVVDNYEGDTPDVAVGLWASGKVKGDDENIQGGEINVNGNLLKITGYSKSGWIYGVYAQNSTTNLKDELATVNINADNTYINVSVGENAKGEGNAIVAMSQGIININSNLEVYGDNAIVARGGAVVKINEDGSKTTKLNGDINFNYDEGTSGTEVNADININFNGEDSIWEGNTIVGWALDNDDNDGISSYKDIKEKLAVDSCNITLSNGAQWNATKAETTGTDGKEGTYYIALNNLTLKNGVINLEKMQDQELQIENLSGNGGTVNVASAENKLSITNSKGENTALTVAASGNYAEQLVQNNVNESLQNLANQVVDNTPTGAGKSAATDLYVAETAVAGAITAEVGKDGNLLANTVKEGVNTTNEAISNMANIALMAWRAENNDMNKRLGELRDSKGEHGIWARMVRGEGTYESIKNQYNTYQLGYDEKLSTNPNWTVGAALSYTEGESSFNGGSGENKHTGFAVYGSYLNDDGSFIDLIAKYARLDHDFDVNGGAGSGDYDTNGYSVSAEYGKRFTQDNGMWIEPQVELTYGKIGSANYTTDNGVSVRQDGMDSLVGRVGFALGKDFKQGNAYVRASYLYDFDGETDISFTKGNVTRGFEQDLGGGWFEVGVGTNINLSDATHLYMDVEKTYGGDIATPWQWNVGVRYSF